MYKHILLPTDGSALSREAVQSGIALAKSVGAAVTALHVIPQPHHDVLEAWMHHDAHYPERLQALLQKFGNEYLAFAADRATAEGVRCACRVVTGSEPYLSILKTAEHERCDLIFMASHGWKGEIAELPGSETLKVLAHSKVPVLVHRPASAQQGYGK